MKAVRVLAVVALLMVFVALRESDSCGPFIPAAQFHYVLGPPDTAAYDAGQLGVVRPTYYRRNLIVAYRYFTGVPLTPDELRAIAPPRVEPPAVIPANQPPKFSYETPAAAQVWLQARNAVPGVQAITSLPVERDVPGQQFEQYQDCLDDAFTTAASTLKQRISVWHTGSPQLADWIAGQDLVFQNCSAGVHIPAAPPAGAEPMLAADRVYQIAAAEFYAGKFDEAQRDFGAIAANAASPWSKLAPYLVARVLIRKATLGEDPTAMQEGRDRLQAILNNLAQGAMHEAAQGLLHFVEAQLDPEARLATVGKELVKAVPGPQFQQDLIDFTHLWDKLNHGPAASSELADWIATFQAPDGGKHAMERWQQTKSSAWLAAALSNGSAGAPPELLAAARELKRDDPAYATATYFGLKLQIAASPDDSARRWADDALAAKQPPAVHNAFLSERLLLATDWSSFLRYAPRAPVANNVVGWDEPLEDDQASGALLDIDSVRPMNEFVPLSHWADAASNPLLPKNLQARVAQAGWVRAVVLARLEEGRKLAGRLAELKPELAASLHPYLTEQDAANAQFDAVFLMLRDPGFDVQIRAGYPRRTKVEARDELRDNWWNLARVLDTPSNPPLPKDFLPADERAAGAAESKAIAATAAIGPNYLAAHTMDWAQRHPDDPRVPEALHLIVEATHYTEADPKSVTDASRKAFQLLHARYPDSKWAKLTRYWY
jgi:hypothetical protein